MESSPTMRSLGDVIAPFVKRKPKPKNPNAVQELKNRRTEMANRERNNAANGHNGLSNPSSYLDNPLESPDLRRTTSTPLVLFDDNVIKRDELPPPRSKPLARDIKILLAVLGTVGAILLILYLAKKIFYDKIHKNKSGKISHAYAHFRRFQKKKKNGKNKLSGDRVETVCDVETKMSHRSSESGLGTMNATEAASNKEYQANGSMQHSQYTGAISPNFYNPHGNLEDGFKNNNRSVKPHARADPVPRYDKQHANATVTATQRYSSDSTISDQDRYHQRRKRKRRRKRSSQTEKISNERVIQQRPVKGYPEHGQDNNCTFVVKDASPAYDSRHCRNGPSKPRVEKRVHQTSHISKDEIYPSSVFDENQTRSTGRTWRDRTYS